MNVIILTIDEWVNDQPSHIEKNYKSTFRPPIEEVRKGGQDWFLGTGVLWKDHPLKDYIPEWAGTRCGNCKGTNTKIIAAQWSVSYASGDSYWDCEIFCEDCEKYTQRAFSEND
jgi:hypothetical protein